MCKEKNIKLHWLGGLLSTVDHKVGRDQLVNCGRYLFAIKTYLPHQYEKQLFVWRNLLNQLASAKKPSPK
jgi:hypothetical protein